MKRSFYALFWAVFLLSLPAWGQDPSQPLPETKELVSDLFGDEVRLYFNLPDNMLVFVDKTNNTRQVVTLGANERNALLTAYMRACDRANTLKDGQQDEGSSITMGDREVTFKVARKENRSWVVIYVGGVADGQKARFAVPQVWDLKDPKFETLYGIKSGFERLLIKSAL